MKNRKQRLARYEPRKRRTADAFQEALAKVGRALTGYLKRELGPSLQAFDGTMGGRYMNRFVWTTEDGTSTLMVRWPTPSDPFINYSTYSQREEQTLKPKLMTGTDIEWKVFWNEAQPKWELLLEPFQKEIETMGDESVISYGGANATHGVSKRTAGDRQRTAAPGGRAFQPDEDDPRTNPIYKVRWCPLSSAWLFAELGSVNRSHPPYRLSEDPNLTDAQLLTLIRNYGFQTVEMSELIVDRSDLPKMAAVKTPARLVVEGVGSFRRRKQAAKEEKMVDLKNVAWVLGDWVKMRPRESSEAIGKYLPFDEREAFNAMVRKGIQYAGLVPIKTARMYLKAMRSALKDVGQYGGVPAKLEEERRLLKDAIDELAFEIKHPTLKEGASQAPDRLVIHGVGSFRRRKQAEVDFTETTPLHISYLEVRDPDYVDVETIGIVVGLDETDVRRQIRDLKEKISGRIPAGAILDIVDAPSTTLSEIEQYGHYAVERDEVDELIRNMERDGLWERFFNSNFLAWIEHNKPRIAINIDGLERTLFEATVLYDGAPVATVYALAKRNVEQAAWAIESLMKESGMRQSGIEVRFIPDSPRVFREEATIDRAVLQSLEDRGVAIVDQKELQPLVEWIPDKYKPSVVNASRKGNTMTMRRNRNRRADDRWTSTSVEELKRYLDGVVILDGHGTISINGDCPRVNRVNVAIIHDGSGFNPGAVIYVGESWEHPDVALQAAHEILFEKNLEDREHITELEEEWGEQWDEILTEAWDGMVWPNMPAKAVAEIVEADKYASKYIDVDWYEDPDECEED